MSHNDSRTKQSRHADQPRSALPHSHSHAHGSGQTRSIAHDRYAPGFSALRLSLQVRLGVAILASLVIWVALYGAMQ